jgi:hypothetical protein
MHSMRTQVVGVVSWHGHMAWAFTTWAPLEDVGANNEN